MAVAALSVDVVALLLAVAVFFVAVAALSVVVYTFAYLNAKGNMKQTIE